MSYHQLLKRLSRLVIIFQRLQLQEQCSPMIRWGGIGTGRTAHRSDHEPRRKRKRWLQTAPRAQMRGEISFPKPRSRWTTNQYNSPLVISNWRRQQQKAQIGGETTPFKQTSGKTRIQLQQHKSPPVRRLSSASIGKERRRLTRTSSTIEAEGQLISSFLPSGHAVYCLYALLCVFLFCFAFLAISHVIMPGIEGNKIYPLKMGAIGTRKPEEQLLSWPWIISVHD